MTCTSRALVAVLLLAVASSQHFANCLSVAQVQQLQTYIVGAINASAIVGAGANNSTLPLLPAFVRLAFHDCAGNACDGCINLSLASNKGLQPAVRALESLYTNTTLGIQAMNISRADFWALAGLVAVNYGAKLQKPPPGNHIIYIPSSLVPTSAFLTGRKDCPTAPQGNETDANFPNGLNNATGTMSYFLYNFNFTAAEVVTILGAHTLGRANVSDSGFQGPWVTGINLLNNDYYVQMINSAANWTQAKANGPQSSAQIQWNGAAALPAGSAPGTTAPRLLMLNADMCLAKTFAINATGGANCTFTTCKNATTRGIVDKYAQNNTLWLDSFGATFAKMQNVCGRVGTGASTTIIPCSLRGLTGTQAAKSAAVQAKVASITQAAHVADAVRAAAAAASSAAADSDAAPFVMPDTVVLSEDAATPVVAAGLEVSGRRRHAARKLVSAGQRPTGCPHLDALM